MVYSEYTSTGQMLENELKAQRTEVAAVKSKKDTEAQKVDFAIYTPTEHAGENSKPEHSEN